MKTVKWTLGIVLLVLTAYPWAAIADGSHSQEPLILAQAKKSDDSAVKDWNTIVRALAPGYEEAYGEPRLIDLDVRFAFDEATLLPDAVRQLDELARALVSDKLKKSRFLITGHTDARGSAAYNKDLSARRAEAVRNFLVGKGVDAKRLQTAGRGEEQLKDILDPEGAINRRVEISVVMPDKNRDGAGGQKRMKW